ncbi:nucleotide sugar dehydrogenase [Bacillus wiedmannii]|uniref:nucleotide sugar dehydrogenase n=1 Tax=Bacillus wiedmannii TaxID=1890302 RepID=UPI000BF13859|nr:nucleotide sugar dehydrogenase [Bacillus wiedmannii]PEO38851.1 UDP-N-acetyl-D-glucosamine dehydrogenase [Bacillus wiedmannii]
MNITTNKSVQEMKQKIENRTATIGVIGLGYVGLPLAVEFASQGFSVIGIDTDEKKVNRLNQGISHIMDIPSALLNQIRTKHVFRATPSFDSIQDLDAVSICVPTPLTGNQEPDVSYIEAAVTNILQYMQKGLLIMLESTTYPGTTRELIAQRLFEEKGYVAGEDYYLCFSPERVDPGNIEYSTKQIPKVVGGMTPQCLEIGANLYGTILKEIVEVSSPETAEMSKLLENTFRSVNIAFINEMSLMCERMELDIWEIIDAAATKPFGFMPFYPGPGVGGHCIPLDPMYLYWKGKQHKFFNKFIEIAQEINMNMPYRIVDKIQTTLNQHGKALHGARILLAGMAYKKNINDVRESPSLEIYELLKRGQAHISILDPFVPSFYDQDGVKVDVIQASTCDFETYDCVVLLTEHEPFLYQEMYQHSKLIIDTRNVFKNPSKKVYKMGGKNE